MNTESNSKTRNNSDINIDITETVLTPLGCASLVNEILKGLLYQKSQIPYPYSWLKTIVKRKRDKNNEDESKTRNFTVENHFRVVSNAYDTLEDIMNGIREEFVLKGNDVREVVILFGTSPICPKEQVTISISNLAEGHIERNHVNDITKVQSRILRSIFLSQTWLDSIDASSNCSNTFVFIKKDTPSANETPEKSYFVPGKKVVVSDKVKNMRININFDKESDKRDCCNHMSVFDDQKTTVQNPQVSEETEKVTVWCQSKNLVKGFKDCFVNKVSASELW